MDSLLADLGLTPHEIKLYKILLEEGPNNPSDLAKLTGIHRRNVYDCLARLTQKGLVTYMSENNKKQYLLTNPKRILERYQEKTREAENLLPTLLQAYQANYEHKETLFYRGKNGIKQVLEDQLREGKEILVNATTTSVSQVLKYFFPKYQLLRKEQGIPTRMLFDESYKTPENHAKLQALPLCSVRYLKEFNKTPMSQYVYGNNVAIIVWGEDLIAILIRNKAIAQGFREGFEALWRTSE